MGGSFRDLRVWQAAMSLAVHIYDLTRDWPTDERFGLTSQIRRSVSSVAANIAEGHGRQMPRAFVQFLRIAQGSLRETETHLELAQRVGIADENVAASIQTEIDDVSRMLKGLIAAKARTEPRTTNHEPRHHV